MSRLPRQVLVNTRAYLWPIHAHELKKFVPMLLIFFLVGFNYTLLRGTKDALVVTAPSSGAEALPFFKSLGNRSHGAPLYPPFHTSVQSGLPRAGLLCHDEHFHRFLLIIHVCFISFPESVTPSCAMRPYSTNFFPLGVRDLWPYSAIGHSHYFM